MTWQAQTNYYYLTETQKKVIAEYFERDVEELEFYEVCELLDEVIDSLDGDSINN